MTDLIPGIQLPVKTIDNYHLFHFAVVGALLYTLIFSLEQLYRVKISNSKAKEFFDVVKGSIFWFFIYIAILHLSQGYLYHVEVPRLIVLFVFIFASFFIALERFFVNYVQDTLLRRGKLEKRTIVFLMKTNEEDVLEDARHAAIYDIPGYINIAPESSINLPYL